MRTLPVLDNTQQGQVTTAQVCLTLLLHQHRNMRVINLNLLLRVTRPTNKHQCTHTGWSFRTHSRSRPLSLG